MKNIRNVKSATDSVASFTMPTNSGINFLATNSLQTYEITYELGDGSDSDDIVYEQGYGETTKQPDMNAIELRDGYEFIGWSRDIAETVTEDATYVAKWSYVSSAKSITVTTPESVAKTADDVEPPFTYDALTRYVAILASSLTLSLYFAPAALRAYRVRRYRK
jgi:hypothetical protein